MTRASNFWNILYTLIMIVLAIINLEFLAIPIFINSFFVIGSLFYSSDDINSKQVWSMYITPVTLGLLAFGLVVFGMIFVCDHTITRFNCWLNKEEFKPLL